MINVGILGTNFGKYHAQIYKKIEGYSLKGIFGRDLTKLDAIENELGIKTTNIIEDLIYDPEIDLIDICLPTPLHYKWTIEALEHNKHVYCETPISYDITQLEKIKEASKLYNKHVYVDLFYKFSSPHMYTIEKIKTNSLGKVVSFKSYNKTSSKWGDLGLEKNILNFHIHNIDFLTEVMGMPNSVYANGIDLNNKSVIISTFNYKNAFAVIESHTNLPDNYPFCVGFEVVCEKGTIKFCGTYGNDSKEDFTLYLNDGEIEQLKIQGYNEYEEVIKHMRNCIENNLDSDLIGVSTAMDSLIINKAVLNSIQSKSIIPIIQCS